QLHCRRIGKRLMSVVTLHENWSVTGDWVDEIFRRKLRVSPFRFIPAAAKNPLAFWRLGHLRRDALREFLRGWRVRKLNLLELRSALHEMDVRVIKSRQQHLAIGVDDFRFRPAPQFNLRV